MNTSYWSYVKQQFRQNRRGMVSLYIVAFLAFVAVFADFLANDKPIVAKYQGQWVFPVFKSYAVDAGWMKWGPDFAIFNWKNAEYDFAIRALIPYHSNTKDDNNTYKSPFSQQDVKNWRWRHWMGTASSGQDIAAGMIHGTRVALGVGIIAMSIAAFIGILLGGLAGFLGDDKVKLARGSLWVMLFFGFWAIFFGFYIRRFDIGDSYENGLLPLLGQLLISLLIVAACLLVGWGISKGLSRWAYFSKKTTLPVDIIISRIIEIFNAIPALIFILAFVALLKEPSIWNIMLIIGFVSWTGIARFIRAELLKIRSLLYIEAAKALGFSKWRTMIRHAIPNGLSPVLIAVAFGIAASILLEATLSFLKLSSTSEMGSWGGILQLSRTATPSEWWLAVIPGLAIFIAVACFNFIGDALRDAIDPRLKK